MDKYVIILAGGDGTRAGGGVPKQFRVVGGMPMIWWSMSAFAQAEPDARIIVVMHPGFFDDWDIMTASWPADKRIEHKLVCGGRSRWQSVANALMEVPPGGAVAIHDAARPLVGRGVIERGWQSIADGHGAAIPIVAVTDSLRRFTPGGSEAVDRKDYMAVQTPQMFRTELIKHAYGLGERPEFTDDASVAEAAGNEIWLFEGDAENIKVTNPGDFVIVESLLRGHRP